MPLFVKQYTWEQSSTDIFIVIPLKGANKNTVSILQSNVFVKVSFPPYLFEAALEKQVKPDDTVIKVADGYINVKLKKAEETETWEKLCRDPLPNPKEEKEFLMKLRQDAVDFSIKDSEQKREAKVDQKNKKDRFSVSQQIKLEQDERKRIEDYKSSEKEKAVKELLDFQKNSTEDSTNADLQKQVEHFNKLEEQLANIDSDENDLEAIEETKQELKKEVEKSQKESSKEAKTPEAPNKLPVTKPKKEIFEEDQLSQPVIRGAGNNIDIKFTPRVFPTPLRESRKPEEDEWLEKQAAARERANVDTSDLTEAEKDPLSLKQKGNTFFQQGNFQGAVNVFTHAINLYPKMPELYSNRAACHLKLRNFFKAIEDSSRALELLTPPVEANAKDRMKAYMRRGTAFCELECYAEGLTEYEGALKIDPNNEQLKNDCDKLRKYIQGSYDGELIEVDPNSKPERLKKIASPESDSGAETGTGTGSSDDESSAEEVEVGKAKLADESNQSVSSNQKNAIKLAKVTENGDGPDSDDGA